jgi:outer membrane protein assembly factor BamA
VVQPFHDQIFGSVRLDGEHFIPLFGTTNILTRVGAGATAGGELARQFYLSSFDTIRGVRFGDEDWLLGRNYFFSTVQLVVPLNQIIQVILLNNIEAIAGFDFGAVADRIVRRTFEDGTQELGLWDKRVLNYVFGVNFALGPLLFRLHFARPLNIGATAGTPYGGEWVTNFSIGIAGFGGIYGNQRQQATTTPTGPGRQIVSPSSVLRF